MGRITRQSLRVFRMADATFLPARDLMKLFLGKTEPH